MNQKPDDMLLHYRLVEQIGEGGMGVVWRAVDTRLGRDVAIKILPPDVADDPDRLGRFRREAELLAQLNHPNIVTLFNIEEFDGQHFLVMELVTGRTLDRCIPPGGLDLDDFLGLAVPLVEAVAAAHERNITHRDLKPGNVLVGDDGRLRVLDFGLAKPDPSAEVDATMTAEGRLLGTVAYMSPEQAQGKPVDTASDVFSLGILFHEMATGSRPFQGDNPMSILTSIMRDEPRSVSEAAPRTRGPLDHIVHRCLQKDPAKRYPNAAAIAGDMKALQVAVASGETSAPRVAVSAPASRSRRKLGVAVAIVAAVVVAASLGGWFLHRRSRVNWATEVAIPRIDMLRDASTGLEWENRAWEAHLLATEAAGILGRDDPLLVQAWDGVTRRVGFESDPPGADLYAKAYSDVDGEWILVGRAPVEGVRFPAGCSRVRLDLPDHRSTYDIMLNISFYGDVRTYRVVPEGEIPDDMVWIPGAEQDLALPGIDHLEKRRTDDWLFDRHETTNRQYRQFIDAEGYEDRSLWDYPFVDGDRTLKFEQAMERFVDTTGRRGPAGWEVGDYPEGDDDLPVSGVSWFEAAAYARWAGKRLPSVYHWNQAALTYASGSIVPLSNLGGKEPWPTGSDRSANRFGVYDMSGNVREWSANGVVGGDARFILGGGWDDAGYAFNDAYAQSPWDRSLTNGLRCARPVDGDGFSAELTHAIDLPFRDFLAETPVDDATFDLFRRQFEYDDTPLHATIESEDDQGDWIRQRISFDAAYGSERVEAWLYAPKTPGPHPTVVYFPGSSAIHSDSSATWTGERFSFLLKSGRAVMFPMYKGTYERGDELDSDYPAETTFYKDHVVMWGKDLGRAIDYLEQRDDIDTANLAFYGTSWGGVMGTILPAVEDRIRVNLLYVAGLLFQRSLPEVDQIHYIGRVTQPTIMLNGEYDFFFPVETSQKPMVELLGVPDEHKKYLVYPGSHSVPRAERVRELLAWLDRYQPVP